MASTVIPVQSHQADLQYVDKGGQAVKFSIIGYNVDGDKVSLLTWPKVPSGATVFIRSAAGFRSYDIATGLESGEYLTNLAGVSK